jgi:hypothetical protein
LHGAAVVEHRPTYNPGATRFDAFKLCANDSLFVPLTPRRPPIEVLDTPVTNPAEKSGTAKGVPPIRVVGMADDIGGIEELAVSIKFPMSMTPLPYDVIAGDELPMMVASELADPRVELAVVQSG